MRETDGHIEAMESGAPWDTEAALHLEYDGQGEPRV
jgi:hypothetical protein